MAFAIRPLVRGAALQRLAVPQVHGKKMSQLRARVAWCVQASSVLRRFSNQRWRLRLRRVRLLVHRQRMCFDQSD